MTRPTTRTAYSEALQLLARRPRTRAELVRRLTADGYPALEIDEAVGRLQDDGYVSDYDLAREFIVARASRLRHSAQRLLRDLEARGVAAGVAEAAWKDACEAGDVDPRQALRGQVSRYIARAGGQVDLRGYHRVYNALLRAGHDRKLVDAELEAHLPKTDHNS